MKVLVIDDDPLLVECLCASLQQQGHSSVSASSAAEALPMLPWVDGAIVDGLGGDCWDILDRCKLLHVPCVLCSGDSDKIDAAELMGVPGVLKPAPIKMVLAALGQKGGGDDMMTVRFPNGQ